MNSGTPGNVVTPRAASTMIAALVTTPSTPRRASFTQWPSVREPIMTGSRICFVDVTAVARFGEEAAVGLGTALCEGSAFAAGTSRSASAFPSVAGMADSVAVSITLFAGAAIVGSTAAAGAQPAGGQGSAPEMRGNPLRRGTPPEVGVLGRVGTLLIDGLMPAGTAPVFCSSGSAVAGIATVTFTAAVVSAAVAGGHGSPPTNLGNPRRSTRRTVFPVGCAVVALACGLLVLSRVSGAGDSAETAGSAASAEMGAVARSPWVSSNSRMCAVPGGGHGSPPTNLGKPCRSVRVYVAIPSLRLSLFELGDQLRHNREQIAYHSKIGDVEDRGVRILIDRDNCLRRLHTGLVLDRTRNPQRHVKIW